MFREAEFPRCISTCAADRTPAWTFQERGTLQNSGQSRRFFADLSGDGENLADVARGKVRRSGVFFHYAQGRDAILGKVTDRWKYAWSAPDQKEFLFDRKVIPEKRNLAEMPSGKKATERIGQIVRDRASQYPFGKSVLNTKGAWIRNPVKRMPRNPDAGLLYQDPPKARPELPKPFHLDYPKKNFSG